MGFNIVGSAILEFAADIGKLTTGLNDAARNIDKNFSKIQKSCDQLKTAFAAVTAGVAVGKILEMADSYNVLQARIQMATKATGDYKAVSDQLFKISKQTGASLKDSTDVFQRLSIAAGSLGASNKDMLQLTATVQKLGVMGGASTQALNAGLLQFGQAMGAGVVRAEELNSIIENMPLVAQKIAEGMGMTTAQLRKAVLDGKVLSKDVFESLKKQAPEIAKEFEKMPVSLGRAIEATKNSFQKALGELDQSFGITKTLAAGLMLIADNAKTVTAAIVGMGVAAAVFKAMTIDLKGVSGALALINTTMMANPYAAAGAAILGVVAALVTFKDTAFSIGESQVTLTNLVKATWEKISPVVIGVWNGIVKAVSAAAQAVMSMAQQLWKGIVQQVQNVIKVIKPILDALGKLPFFQAFKQAGEAIGNIYNQVSESAKKMGAEFAKQTDEIVKRAAEITKAEQGIGEVSGAHGKPAPPPIDEKAKAAAKMQEHIDKFFRTQLGINNAKQIELQLGKQAAEQAELAAQFREQVGRDMLPKELAQLKQILDVRQKLAKIEAIKSVTDQAVQENEMLQLKLQGMEYLIPAEQQLYQLKQQGFKLTEAEKDLITDLAVANYQEEKNIQTQEYIKKLDEQNLKLQEEITLGKEQAAINAAIREAKEQNKFIDDAALQNIKDRLEKEKDLTKQLEDQKKWKELVKDIDKQARNSQIGLVQNKALRDQLEAQAAAADKMGRELTDWEKEIVAAGAAQKTFADDAKRAQDIIKENRTEQEQFNDKVIELNNLMSQGLLTFEDYARAVKSASPEFKKIQEFAKETAKTFSNAMDDWLFKGKSLKDTFKDMGKALLANVAKKALFDPLEGGLTKWIENALWKGPKTGTGGGGIGGLANGGGGYGYPNSPYYPTPARPPAPGGVGGMATNGTYTLAGNTYQTGDIYSSGNVYISGGVNGASSPGGGGFFASLQNTLSNMFNGLFSGLKNIISAPFSMLGNLFGGGGQGGGLLGGLFGGGLSQIGGLLNPLGLLGGIGKAFVATMGGGNIITDILPLLNPFGLMKGIGSAIGGVFGGGRALGGGVVGGTSYLVGERGPELFTPGQSGYISNAYSTSALMSQDQRYKQMMDAVMMTPGGTPLYQQMGQSFQRDYSVFNSYDKAGDTGNQGWEVERLLAKKNAYAAMTPDQQRQARTTGEGYFNNEDSARLFALINNQSLGVSDAFNRLYGEQLNAGVNAILNNDAFTGNIKSWAALTQGNKTWSAIGAGNNLMKTMLPLGNQLGNIVNRWSFAGVNPTELLNRFSNTRDSIMDELEPYGGWKLQGYGYNSMGMGGGMGAPNADYYESDKPEKNSWGSYGSGRWNYTGVRPWGASSAIQNPYNQQWGSGVGYSQGWMGTGTPFKNNSLLGTGGNGVLRYLPTYTNYGGPAYLSKLRDVMSRPPLENPYQNPINVDGSFRNASGSGGVGSGWGKPGLTGTEQTLKDMQPYIQGGIWPNTLGQTGAYGRYPGQAGYIPGVGWVDAYGQQSAMAAEAAAQYGGMSGTEYTLRDMIPLGYQPQYGWSGQEGWFNALIGNSANLGSYLPQMQWLRNIGTFGTIPGFADGGKFSGGVMMVGEEGPELIQADTSGRVIPNHELGGGKVEVNVYTSTAAPVTVREEVRNGGRRRDIYIEEVVGSAINRGGAAARAVKNVNRMVERG